MEHKKAKAGRGGGSPMEDQAQEHLYKILVIGDFGVGKTSVIRRYTEDVFSPNYKLTIGVDFSLKSLTWEDGLKINLQLWDIAGHERFGHMTRVYYKYAIGAIIVFDLTRQVTFDSVAKWLGDVNQKVLLENGDPVPVIILANKCDTDNPQVDTSKVEEFCTKHNLLGWFATSAKLGTNINEAMEALVTKILDLSSKEMDLPVDVVDLGTASDSSTHPSKLTPADYTTQTDPYTNGNTTYDSASSYSKLVHMKGLSSNGGPSEPPPQRQSGCCS